MVTWTGFNCSQSISFLNGPFYSITHFLSLNLDGIKFNQLSRITFITFWIIYCISGSLQIPQLTNGTNYFLHMTSYKKCPVFWNWDKEMFKMKEASKECYYMKYEKFYYKIYKKAWQKWLNRYYCVACIILCFSIKMFTKDINHSYTLEANIILSL